MKVKSSLSIAFMLFGSIAATQAFAENPHEISSQSQALDCVSCHVNKPQSIKAGVLETKNHRTDVAAFKGDGVEMCSGCHDPGNGHKVNLKLDFEIPADMPTGAKNKLTCLTCHYTHGSLSSNRPQASVSFMDRMLDAERLQKSFLLRRNNVDGELCLICHEVKEGSNNVK